MGRSLSRACALVFVVAVVGMLPWLSGDDPALALLRARSAEQEPTPEALAAIRADLGLDAGPLGMLGSWLGGLLQGDAGVSWVSGVPVLPGVLSALGVSLLLMAVSLAAALLVAVMLVARTLVRGAGGSAVRGPGGAGAMLASVPEFLIAIVGLIVVSVWLGWLPPYGWVEPRHMILPALALGIPAGGLLGHLIADSLCGTFQERWVNAWLAAGCTRTAIAMAVLKRSLPALLPQTALVVVGLTGGAVVVETVFAIPGLGRTALGAAKSRDLPLLQTSVLALVMLGMAAGACADLLRRRMLGTGLTGAALNPPESPRRPRGPVLPAVLAFVLCAVAMWGLLRDATAVDTVSRLAGPAAARPMGADALGRDVLARLGHGATATVGIAFLVCAASYLVGIVVGFFPAVASGAAETANALPPVLCGIIVVAVLGPGVAGASLAVGLVSWAPLALHTSALVEEVRAAPHLMAQRAIGSTGRRIFWRHVLPAVAGPVGRHALLRLPPIALSIASLGFLGLGAQPPASEWGLMLAESLPYMERAPWAALAPAAALAVLAALAVTLSDVKGRRSADVR